ncbi:hypothetical protein BGX27_001416 [Mortierella sp. AM989]|nr:hypothetical protein BGX27_001416 [Mortierella sp. AM989]
MHASSCPLIHQNDIDRFHLRADASYFDEKEINSISLYNDYVSGAPRMSTEIRGKRVYEHNEFECNPPSPLVAPQPTGSA